jgi:hypothetical protein
MYEWEEGMCNIIGENTEEDEKEARYMLKKGLEWFDRNPNATPQFKSYKEIKGLIVDDNMQAAELLQDMTGDINTIRAANLNVIINHLFYIRKFGWEAYVKEMKA